VVDRIEDSEGNVIEKFKPSQNGKIPVSNENLDYIKRALYGVVNEPQGTGGRARVNEVSVGGKTGTAQVVGLKGDDRRRDRDYEKGDHAWFIAFAPVDRPKLVVVVIVEHGGHGGSTAAPIARKIIEYYFKRPQTAMRIQ
jgi:penicillin-binding protein 2